jgi:hypothetical protein
MPRRKRFDLPEFSFHIVQRAVDHQACFDESSARGDPGGLEENALRPTPSAPKPNDTQKNINSDPFIFDFSQQIYLPSNAVAV